jgi:hypothetical protein
MYLNEGEHSSNGEASCSRSLHIADLSKAADAAF